MTMRAMRLNETGGRLVEETLAVPEPGPGQVLVRVAACAVNFADTLMVKGRYQETPDLPFSPGLEVAGTVEALGAGVEGPAPGTRVAALPGHGGMAEYVLAPAATVVPVPDAMDMRAAAGLQVAYGTAHVALWHRAGLKPGERLVVTGAAGGAGLAAVAVGALMGAEVVAVARGEARLETVRAVGAAHAIDPTAGDLREALLALGGVDVVYETVGGDMWKGCLRAARPEARLLPLGFAGGDVP
ncbi:MAG: zinc-binding dehydrogenase, partial [Pseudomonadota bacterium]